MHRSLTVSHIAASSRLYSTLTATPIATLPRHILRRPDIGSTARIYIRRETPTAQRGGPTPYNAQTTGDHI